MDAEAPKDPRTPKTPVTAKSVSLAYVDASWSRVLQNFADAAGLELVAEKFPAKKFSRYDTSRYTISDAQKILTSEIERCGFKMVVQGNELVVTSKLTDRKQYNRPLMPSSTPREAVHDIASASQNFRPKRPVFSSSDVRVKPREADPQPASRQAAAASRKNMTPVVTQPAEHSLSKSDEPIQRVRNEDAPANVTRPSSDKPAAPLRRPPQPRVIDPITSVVKLRNRTALPLARNVFEGFRPQAELVKEAARGLPGFRVIRKADPARGIEAEPRFTVSIDQDHNELIVQGDRDEAQAAARLLTQLDLAQEEQSQAVRIVATTKDAERVAAALQPKLDELARLPAKVRLAQAPPGAAGAQPAEGEAELPAQPGDQPADSPMGRKITIPRKGGEPVEQFVPDLKGEVDIEAMTDLGVLIIKGNREDVEKVMQIIRQIEQLSVGTAPNIELLYLRNVSSESLSLLLTEIYGRLSTVRTRNTQQSQTVTVIPLARPNAVLILASAADMPDVKDLAAKLDRPSDPTSEFKVFRLKRAVASQVATHLQDLYGSGPPGTQGAGGQPAGQGQNGGAGIATMLPRVRTAVDIRLNALIIQARPRDLEEVAALIEDLDGGAPETVSQIRIFPLKNAIADELANTLQNAVQAAINPARQPTQQGGGGQNQFAQQGAGGTGTQGAQELREAKSTVLQFMNGQGPDERSLRSGILSDIRISADARTNSIVVTAPVESMDLMEELVKQFDRTSNAVADIKVFALGNSDATTMVTLLEGLFGQQGQGQGQGQNQGAQLGIQLAGAEDASSTIIPLRFNADTRTNSVIAIGGSEALRVVEAVLYRLDQSDVRQRETQVYRLVNAPAEAVATSLTNFITSRRAATTANPDLISPFEQLDREVIVVAEPVSNSLLLSATPRYFEEMRTMITKLDAVPGQVIIQVLLVEVQLDNTDEFGMELGLQDSLLFNRSVKNAPTTINQSVTQPNGNVVTNQQIISQTATPGFAFNNQPLGNNIFTSPGNFAGQALSNFSLARINGDLGYGGLVLSGGSESISVLIRALSSRRRVDVLSRPQIRALNNQLAQIQVGSQFPRVTGVQTNTNTGNSSPVTTPVDLGIILQVIPRVTPQDDVVMEVIATKSGLQPGAGVTIFTNPDGSTITSPVVDITTARTSISVHDGQTIVMGGMITKSEATAERKVPLLGDIPILGIPFRYDSRVLKKTELIIFLTPRIVHNDFEAEMIKQIEMDRLHFIESEAEEIHGPLRAFEDALNCPPSDGSLPPEMHPDLNLPPTPGRNIFPGDQGAQPDTLTPAPRGAIEVTPPLNLQPNAEGVPQSNLPITPPGSERVVPDDPNRPPMDSSRPIDTRRSDTRRKDSGVVQASAVNPPTSRGHTTITNKQVPAIKSPVNGRPSTDKKSQTRGK